MFSTHLHACLVLPFNTVACWPTPFSPARYSIFTLPVLRARASCDSRGISDLSTTSFSVSRKSRRLDQNSQMFPLCGKRIFPLHNLLWQLWLRRRLFIYQINEAALKTLNLLQTAATMTPFSHEPCWQVSMTDNSWCFSLTVRQITFLPPLGFLPRAQLSWKHPLFHNNIILW